MSRLANTHTLEWFGKMHLWFEDDALLLEHPVYMYEYKYCNHIIKCAPTDIKVDKVTRPSVVWIAISLRQKS